MRQAAEMSAVSARRSDAGNDVAVFCAFESDSSTSLSVRCAGAPTTPRLRVDNMNEDGIDVAWDMSSDQITDDDVTVRIAFTTFVPRPDTCIVCNRKTVDT